MDTTQVQSGFEVGMDYNKYVTEHPEEFETHDPETGRKYSMAYPKGVFDSIRVEDNIRRDAEKLLNGSSASTGLVVADDECCLTSLKHHSVLEQLIAGESREQVAKNHSIGVSTVNRILYSPQSRRTIATIINGANTRLANNVDLMVEVAANQLMTLMTTGDSKQRLAAIDRTFKFWDSLTKLGLAKGARATHSKTVKNNDGSVDKMTLTGKLDA